MSWACLVTPWPCCLLSLLQHSVCLGMLRLDMQSLEATSEMHFGVLKKSLLPQWWPRNGHCVCAPVMVLRLNKFTEVPVQTRFSAVACRYFFHTTDESCSVTDSLKLGDELQQVRGNAGIIQELIGVCQFPPPLAGVWWNNWENMLEMWQPVSVFFLSAQIEQSLHRWGTNPDWHCLCCFARRVLLSKIWFYSHQEALCAKDLDFSRALNLIVCLISTMLVHALNQHLLPMGTGGNQC